MYEKVIKYYILIIPIWLFIVIGCTKELYPKKEIKISFYDTLTAMPKLTNCNVFPQ